MPTRIPVVKPPYPVAVASVTAGSCRPDHMNRDSAFTCAGDHVGCAAVATGGLAVPDGPELVGLPEHEPARLHVRFRGGLGDIQPVHGTPLHVIQGRQMRSASLGDECSPARLYLDEALVFQDPESTQSGVAAYPVGLAEPWNRRYLLAGQKLARLDLLPERSRYGLIGRQ